MHVYTILRVSPGTELEKKKETLWVVPFTPRFLPR